jgi:N-formylglutamate deformylase
MILGEHSAPPYLYRRGASALIVSMPHVGTYVPASIGRAMADVAAQRPDTDWHLPRLYDFLDALGATVIAATHSRYVIDLNRPPDNTNLYPGQDTTGLCPVDTFDKRALYRDAAPGEAQIAQRIERYWKPYHRRLAAEIARVKGEHGRAILWDAHSIVSVAPRFFAGRLPDFNLGTAGGTSCAPELARRLLAVASRDPAFSAVLDGRFKGGHITRRHGDPASGMHAVQMEMAEVVYMDERPPYPFRGDLAARVRPILREMLEISLHWAE